MEQSIAAFKDSGPMATDSELGAAHFKLGLVFWEMAGSFRKERQFSHRQLLAAAALDGPCQVGSLGLLMTHLKVS